MFCYDWLKLQHYPLGVFFFFLSLKCLLSPALETLLDSTNSHLFGISIFFNSFCLLEPSLPGGFFSWILTTDHIYINVQNHFSSNSKSSLKVFLCFLMPVLQLYWFNQFYPPPHLMKNRNLPGVSFKKNKLYSMFISATGVIFHLSQIRISQSALCPT